jgi:phenylalanyl-tRNA synthetase alpha chain
MIKTDQIIETFLKEITITGSLEKLNELRIKYLGKKGEINSLMQEIKDISPEERKDFGQKVNAIKEVIEKELNNKKIKLEEGAILEKLSSESLDVTLPIRYEKDGKIHPLSKVAREIEEIFTAMGFSMAVGPEIEDDWHNFTALNTPENHPARQMQDTFYMPDIEDGKKIVLRTQTSSVQIRNMENSKPPFKFITIGKVFRCDSDATHTPMFHQVEGVYIDKNITMSQMKGCLLEFVQKFFELDEVPPSRLRPSYFPFTEPSGEMDIRCHKGKGELIMGEGKDWMEILGCGMVHPEVIRNVGLNPDEYQGFAFGTGLERLTMLKYGVSDMRMLFECDLRFLKHYGFRFFE